MLGLWRGSLADEPAAVGPVRLPALQGDAMKCSECNREHVITGEVRIDDVILPDSWIECLVETACERGKLVPVEPAREVPGRVVLRRHEEPATEDDLPGRDDLRRALVPFNDHRLPTVRRFRIRAIATQCPCWDPSSHTGRPARLGARRSPT